MNSAPADQKPLTGAAFKRKFYTQHHIYFTTQAFDYSGPSSNEQDLCHKVGYRNNNLCQIYHLLSVSYISNSLLSVALGPEIESVIIYHFFGYSDSTIWKRITHFDDHYRSRCVNALPQLDFISWTILFGGAYERNFL